MSAMGYIMLQNKSSMLRASEKLVQHVKILETVKVLEKFLGQWTD